MGRVDEALQNQLRLEREADLAGKPDRYVFEELNLLCASKGEPDRTRALRRPDRCRQQEELKPRDLPTGFDRHRDFSARVSASSCRPGRNRRKSFFRKRSAKNPLRKSHRGSRICGRQRDGSPGIGACRRPTVTAPQAR
jgi:hypothetical protein